MGKMQREKGKRIELEIVRRHRDAGTLAKRLPMSGASAYTGDHDVDVYPFGEEAGALVAEVKSGVKVPKTVIKWLGENDLLFMRPDRMEPIVIMPWAVWERILKALK